MPHAVQLSLFVAALATLLSLPFAVLVAWWLERRSGRLRGLVQILVLLPLVLPPVVTGSLLLQLFAPRGALGGWLASIGLPVAFELTGAVVAAAVVGFPLFVLQLGQAFASIDPRLEEQACSLGLPPWRVFLRVSLPLAWPGLLAGATLAFARGLGEFGATIVLAGHVRGVTDTLPLAVHAALQTPGGEREVLVLCAWAVALAVLAALGFRALLARHRKRLEWGA
ncbi:MAG: molybdate ABC transporter permease [Planctomycetota bacterium]|nr:MAG: molybdate ABC transporter permease [Planctomycetota bacterium]